MSVNLKLSYNHLDSWSRSHFEFLEKNLGNLKFKTEGPNLIWVKFGRSILVKVTRI